MVSRCFDKGFLRRRGRCTSDCQLAGNDCNSNSVPDDCDTDCNSNATPDACETITDCNSNSIPDECELTGNDCNSDLIPDDCQLDLVPDAGLLERRSELRDGLHRSAIRLGDDIP